jgi:hypothetical protein
MRCRSMANTVIPLTSPSCAHMPNIKYIKTRKPATTSKAGRLALGVSISGRVWEKASNGGWYSRPVTDKDLADRASLSRTLSKPMDYERAQSIRNRTREKCRKAA